MSILRSWALILSLSSLNFLRYSSLVVIMSHDLPWILPFLLLMSIDLRFSHFQRYFSMFQCSYSSSFLDFSLAVNSIFKLLTSSAFSLNKSLRLDIFWAVKLCKFFILRSYFSLSSTVCANVYENSKAFSEKPLVLLPILCHLSCLNYLSFTTQSPSIFPLSKMWYFEFNSSKFLRMASILLLYLAISVVTSTICSNPGNSWMFLLSIIFFTSLRISKQQLMFTKQIFHSLSISMFSVRTSCQTSPTHLDSKGTTFLTLRSLCS